MPEAVSFLSNPISFVDKVFEEMHFRQQKPVSEVVRKIVDDQKVALDSGLLLMEQIPSLNNPDWRSLGDGRVVRFRGMIQDMHGPEYFPSILHSHHRHKPGLHHQHTGLFRDFLPSGDWEVDVESSLTKLSERHLFTCICIPGQTSWVRSQQEVLDCVGPLKDISVSSSPDGEEVKSMETEDVAAAESSLELAKWKKTVFPCTGVQGEAQSVCLAKVYCDWDGLKLNQMVDLVGVLSWEASSHDRPMEEEALELPASAAPSVVPRLHVIFHRRLSHDNPLLSSPTFQTGNFPFLEVKRALVDCLAGVLGGDVLSADFLLLSLISNVQSRLGSTAIGSFPLNLTHPTLNSSIVSRLDRLLQSLVTKMVYIPLSVEQLNGEWFVPKKDYGKEKLVSGRLQLSDGTLLLVDETQMHPGRLDQRGIQNLGALQSLTKSQTLDYDFQFHKSEFQTDLNVLILSEAKSIIPMELIVPIKPAEGVDLKADVEELELPAEIREQCRVYLTLARQTRFRIPEALQDDIQKDFVQMRQRDSAISADQLHRLLQVSRLVCASAGQRELTKEIWEEAKALEKTRLDRF